MEVQSFLGLVWVKGPVPSPGVKDGYAGKDPENEHESVDGNGVSRPHAWIDPWNGKTLQTPRLAQGRIFRTLFRGDRVWCSRKGGAGDSQPPPQQASTYSCLK